MRIAVAGGSGHIGALTALALERDGHDVVRISRSLGVDLLSSEGMDDALACVEVVVDATNTQATSRAEVVAYFATITWNLLAAEQRVGVVHGLGAVGVEVSQPGARGTRARHNDDDRHLAVDSRHAAVSATLNHAGMGSPGRVSDRRLCAR